ncbi:MAG: 4-phosphopantetheinyl transferase family protein [Crocinitomicaceae bacterium]|jgi:phosphopantetheinyl transferase|nr:4-phosphopantetheinyl transferase family protein [Crocinitomicaceae bacterium]
MPYQLHRLELHSSTIHLLEFSDEFDPKDYLDTLTDIERERYFAFKHDKRRQEFVATRFLRHQLFGYEEIKYRDHGAPYLENAGFISISHARNLVGIASNPGFAIGFDMEEIHPKVLKLTHKFLNENELLRFDEFNAEEMISCWSYKETLYKLAGRKRIDFKKDLLLLEKRDNGCIAKIINPDEVVHVELETLRFKEYVITINAHEVSYVRN